MTAISLREMPHNFEAEQALLGAILMDGSAFQNAAEIVQPSHFADPLHGRLFEMLGRMIERGQVVSAFTLKTYAESDEGLKAAGGASYLAKLATASVHAFDAVGALDKLEGFASFHGADFYGLPRNSGTITLRRESWTPAESFAFGEAELKPLRSGESLPWRLVPA